MNRSLPMLLALVGMLTACGERSTAPAPAPAAKPALTVVLVQPQAEAWPQVLAAGGNVAAWQEAVIGPEVANQRITEVKANVGDVVRRGQRLAGIAPEMADTEYAEYQAGVAEATASLAEAKANHERAVRLREKGFFSAQQETQAEAAAQTARARLEAARARLQSADLRRSKTAILAPDDGIVSARNATVGSTVQPGQELFRLIRGGRLEWRAEVAAADLVRIPVGAKARLTVPGGAQTEATVRAVAPTVDPRTHTALVYADLPAPAPAGIASGMYLRGEILLGSKPARTLPQSALVLRDGYAYVFVVERDKVVQTKVGVGRRNAERVEVEGLAQGARVVAAGVGFLADGDTVKVAGDGGAAAR